VYPVLDTEDKPLSPRKPENKPGKKPVIKDGVKPVSVSKPAVKPPSQVKPLTPKQLEKKPATKKIVNPVSEPAVEPPDYIKEWATAPYERLRTICEEHPTSYVSRAQFELQEPVYALRDVEVRDMMWKIQDGIEDVAALFQGNLPKRWGDDKSRTLTRIYESRDVSTSRILKGVAGAVRWTDDEEWHDTFASDNKRRALVCGIIGNMLVEQVFKHPFFGGDAATIDTLFDLQKELRDEDAFARKHASATVLATHFFGKNLASRNLAPTAILNTPENFTTHVDVIVTALDTHLRPLFLQMCATRDMRQDGIDRAHFVFIKNLTRLVATAGLLSLQMAADPFTVYYHVPIAKGERFEHAAHVAFNDAEMKRTNPRSPDAVFPTEEKRKHASKNEALISMVLMNGLTAYRCGGWEDAKSDPEWDGESFTGRVYAKEEYAEVGYRGRLLTHGWVFCKWGRAKIFN
jgi:hypothetical protein